ncbi:hypothetical protein [Longimicrobium sp.]|uniref:hypothetical protein n=1 Tax=Longimicrobium sp. TaxID=2029185 RepID=UPI002E302ADF|nr:hypothetical protein [Longimicrobium sp.]HEX6039306.1 hypothetical protein [Longimicrobium sp.]
MKRLLLIVLALAAGCSHPQRTAPEPRDLVWVATVYTGGVQCARTDTYRPPNTVEVLRGVRVPVYGFLREPLPVCEACSCPSYSSRHYVLIARRDADRAARAGYPPRNPPPGALPADYSPPRQPITP